VVADLQCSLLRAGVDGVGRIPVSQPRDAVRFDQIRLVGGLRIEAAKRQKDCGNQSDDMVPSAAKQLLRAGSVSLFG
jgi:hypothetical protein